MGEVQLAIQTKSVIDQYKKMVRDSIKKERLGDGSSKTTQKLSFFIV